MGKASQKFFASPKLLEKTLLFLYSDVIPAVPAASVKELFILQRVNRKFDSAIRTSPKLRWKMDLASYLPHAELRPVLHFAVIRITQGDFRIKPFKFCLRSSIEHTRLSTNRKALWLVFRVEADYFAEEYQGALGFRAGLQSGDGKIYRNRNQSWRQMRLTARDGPIAVVVFLRCPRTRMATDAFSGPFYEETVSFRPGEGTLGDLADFFEQIGRKERIEHELGIVRHRGEFWKDVRPEEKQGRDWWRIAALLARCVWLCMLYIAGHWAWESTKSHPLVLSMVLGLLGSLWVVGSASAFTETAMSRKDMDDKKGVRSMPIFN